MTKELISSYPNKYFMSKHQRFRNDDVCACACDCDMLLKFIDKKRGELCDSCEGGDHQCPVYKDFQVKHKGIKQ